MSSETGFCLCFYYCHTSAHGSVAFFFLTESIFKFKKKNIIIRESSFYQLGQSPKILRPKPHGLERTDSQTVADFATRRKGMYLIGALGIYLFSYFFWFRRKEEGKGSFSRAASQCAALKRMQLVMHSESLCSMGRSSAGTIWLHVSSSQPCLCVIP